MRGGIVGLQGLDPGPTLGMTFGGAWRKLKCCQSFKSSSRPLNKPQFSPHHRSISFQTSTMSSKTVEIKPFQDQKPGTYVASFSQLCVRGCC
jgi:hypothetical protein